jgi:hypothetical protein
MNAGMNSEANTKTEFQNPTFGQKETFKMECTRHWNIRAQMALEKITLVLLLLCPLPHLAFQNKLLLTFHDSNWLDNHHLLLPTSERVSVYKVICFRWAQVRWSPPEECIQAAGAAARSKLFLASAND